MTLLDNSLRPTSGRVAFFAHGHARVATPVGDFAALAAPWLEPVVVGDRVDLEPNDPLLMVRRHPRTSALVRRDPAGGPQTVAANVDRALVCMSCDGDFNVRRLERWLIVVREAGVDATVLLTKSDRADDRERLVAQAAGVFGEDVLPVSVASGDGVEALRGLLAPEQTYVMLGSSGVGKSTLANALLGVELAPTGAVRDDDRGRHTTTGRHLYRLPNGAFLIDNPGIRAVGPLSDADLGIAYPEIEALVEACRYRDCAHATEPGCAVRAARESGDLDEQRFAAWCRLGRELEYESRRGDRRAEAEARKRWKRVHKARRALGKSRARDSDS